MAVFHPTKPWLVRSGGIRMKYAELCTTSNFTFLEGASHPEELVTRAAAFGLEAIAITDRNTLAGVVRAYAALKELKREADEAIKIRSQTRIDPSSRQDRGSDDPIERPSYTDLPRLIVGSRLGLQNSSVEWLALPTDRAAYSRLTRLLTVGKRRAKKGECHLLQADLLEWGKGMILIALLQNDPLTSGEKETLQQMQTVARRFPGNTFLGAAPRYDGRDKSRIDAFATLAHRAAVPMVAVGDVLMHHGNRRQLADILTCMREGITIDQKPRFAQCRTSP